MDTKTVMTDIPSTKLYLLSLAKFVKVLINNLVHNFLESHLLGKSIENFYNNLNNKLISNL